MKKICISFLIVLAFGISFYFYSGHPSVEPTKYGSWEVLLVSIPVTMLIANSYLFILPRLIGDAYRRYKNGFESIFLSLSLILIVLHTGLLLLATGFQVNILLLIPISVGIVLITTANTLPRFQLDTKHSSSDLTQPTQKAWNIMIRPFSFPLFIGGIIMLLCVFLPENLTLISFFAVLAGTLLISLFRSYKAYRTHSHNL